MVYIIQFIPFFQVEAFGEGKINALSENHRMMNAMFNCTLRKLNVVCINAINNAVNYNYKLLLRSWW